jgi:hypothetical protein
MCTREDDIKFDLREIGRDGLDKIELAQGPMELYCEQQA